MSEQAIRLTQYSHGAGCGCKISPKVLETILHSEQAKFVDPNLLVGNETSDDAAVYDLGNGTSIVSTTDFFMPIVDNPFDFGRIAATNAISDIFAMGGKPIMAIAILGWPINTLAPEIAREVVEGGRFACQQAGIALAGGHSIDAPEPIFGLAVTGVVPTERIKKNSTAQAGCKLYLTKPLGNAGVGFVVPDDSRLSFDILIPPEDIMGARMGYVVVVELTQRPTRRTKAVGKIVEVLGDNMGTGMAVDMALRTHEIPYVWPPAVKNKFPASKSRCRKRRKPDASICALCRWSLLMAKMPATSMTRCTARRNAAAAGVCGWLSPT